MFKFFLIFLGFFNLCLISITAHYTCCISLSKGEICMVIYGVLGALLKRRMYIALLAYAYGCAYIRHFRDALIYVPPGQGYSKNNLCLFYQSYCYCNCQLLYKNTQIILIDHLRVGHHGPVELFVSNFKGPRIEFLWRIENLNS